MIIPFMLSNLIFIPQSFSWIGIIGLILAVIVEFRQGYLGRIGMAGNALLLWQTFFSKWTILPIWFQWYLNIGTVLGILAIISYLIKKSLPTEFYKFVAVVYGSLAVILSLVIFKIV